MNELNYFDVRLFEKEGNKIIENLKIIEKLKNECDLSIDVLIASLDNGLKIHKGTYDFGSTKSISTPIAWLKSLKYSNLSSHGYDEKGCIKVYQDYINSDFRSFREYIDRYIEYKEYLKKNIEQGEVNGRF